MNVSVGSDIGPAARGWGRGGLCGNGDYCPLPIHILKIKGLRGRWSVRAGGGVKYWPPCGRREVCTCVYFTDVRHAVHVIGVCVVLMRGVLMPPI